MAKKFRLFLRWVLFLGFVLQGKAWGQQFDFSEIPKIRVYISAAPGMGHQSASVVVMRRLRQVGFQGEFHVVYDDRIATKLPTLLPGFDPNIKYTQNLVGSVTAISESQFFQQNEVEHVKFAVTGADDNRTHLNPQKLHSDTYLLMEPLGWGDSFLFEGESPPRVLTSIRSLGYYFETDTSAQSIENSLRSMEMGGDSARALGLRKLFKKQAYFGAVYGIGTIPLMTVKMKLWIQSVEKAARSTGLDKPLILPIISPQNDFEKRTLDYALQEITFPASLKKTPRIAIQDLADPQFEAYLADMKKGDILLVNVGRVPQNIFEKIFEISQLPVLVAGKNAMNLAQNLGKVYVNTVNDPSLPDDRNLEKARALTLHTHKAFFEASKSEADQRKTVQFIKEALISDSELSQLYKKQSQSNRDKVSEALRLLQFQELGGRCQSVFN